MAVAEYGEEKFAVPLPVESETYPKEAAPMIIKAVPSKAEIARNTKNAARLGARAVPKLSTKKATAVISATYAVQY